MKIALLVYHKNIQQYPKEWINKFRDSILNQTYKDFDIFELEYDGEKDQIFEDSYWFSDKCKTFAEAMNLLIDFCYDRGYDYILNTNIDDFYSLDRIEKQLPYMERGYDVISSNFCLVKDDYVVHTHYFDKLDIKEELDKDHNVICHPVIAVSRNFWGGNYYIPEQIPFEDMNLWKRGIEGGYKFIILPEILCFHRLHSTSVGHKGEEI